MFMGDAANGVLLNHPHGNTIRVQGGALRVGTFTLRAV